MHVTQDVPVEVPRVPQQQRVLGILDEGFVRLFEPLAARITWTSSHQGMSSFLISPCTRCYHVTVKSSCDGQLACTGANGQEVSRTASAIAVVILLVTLQCFLALVRMALALFRINPGASSLPALCLCLVTATSPGCCAPFGPSSAA